LNRSLTQSTDKPQRLLPWYLLVVLYLMASLACVSQPGPAGDVAASAMADAAAPVAVAPDSIAMYRAAPATISAKPPLAEPDVRSPLPAPPVHPAKPSVDITVLSSSPVITFAPVRLPEPIAPAPVASAKPPVAAVAKPVAASPATVAATATQAAKPGATVSGSTASSPAAQPKPAAATGTAPAPAAAKPESSQTAVLPATPASSARVEAASRPVAETKLETSRGERFELRFPGSGWIYLGDELGREGLRYETRRFEDNAAIFAMNPEQVGEYLLRFQRQNPVDRSTEVSLVRVTVADKPASSAAVQPSPMAAGTVPDSYATPGATIQPAAASVAAPTTPSSGTAVPAPASASQPPLAATPATQTAAQPALSPGIDLLSITDPVELIRRARDELDAKRTQSALDALDRYLALYPYGSDEVYFLYGLAYEQDTPFRNIKKSYDAYRRVRDEYPRSARWKDAADRIAYLEKHYFGLR